MQLQIRTVLLFDLEYQDEVLALLAQLNIENVVTADNQAKIDILAGGFDIPSALFQLYFELQVVIKDFIFGDGEAILLEKFESLANRMGVKQEDLRDYFAERGEALKIFYQIISH